MNSISRAFDDLSLLPDLEGGFLRHLLLQAINDPDLATKPALSEHLRLVPQVLRALVLEPDAIRQLDRPGMEEWARLARSALSAIATVAANSHADISHETLAKLSHIALQDPRFLANFLERKPASDFL